MLHVVTTFFQIQRIAGSIFIGDSTLRQKQARSQEYADCIVRNASSSAVAGVHLLCQCEQSLRSLQTDVLPLVAPEYRRRIVPTLFRRQPEQPLYSDLFIYSNQMLRRRLTMVCNADIYVRDDFPSKRISEILEKRRVPTALSLTRYENENLECPLISDYRGSHDAFLFLGPLPEQFVSGVQHRQNCYKAENIVIHELQKCGYDVVNPCHDVCIFHRHEADLRQWMPPVDEERYGRAFPCTLDDVKV